MSKMLHAAIFVIILSLITSLAAIGASDGIAEALLTLEMVEVIAYVGDAGHIGMSDAAHPSILYRLLDDNPSNDNSLNGSSDEFLNELEELELKINSLDPEDYSDLETASETETGYSFTKRSEILSAKLNLISELMLDSGINNEKQKELVIINLEESTEINFALTVQLSPYCVFPDPGLDAAVREWFPDLNGDPIPREQAASLEWLKVNGSKITNLEGIECLTNLTGLHIWNNQISDLGPLAIMTKLEALDVRWNYIEDISPLSELRKLKNLLMSNNYVDDLSSLIELTYLEYLMLDYNQITDIEHLSGLINLKLLYFRNNNVNDIHPLLDLASLSEVWLNNNLCVDPEPDSDAETVILQLITKGVNVHY